MADPRYRQIADDLSRQIVTGQVSPGSRLATALELGERYGASRSTAREAMKVLRMRGLAEFKPGQGTFVTREIQSLQVTLSQDEGTGVDAKMPQYHLAADPNTDPAPAEALVIAYKNPVVWLIYRLTGSTSRALRFALMILGLCGGLAVIALALHGIWMLLPIGLFGGACSIIGGIVGRRRATGKEKTCGQ